MCKIKTYTKQMHDKLERISFRLDFYSFPSFSKQYTECIRQKYSNKGYANRELTNQERILIDVDSVAETFGSNIGGIIEKPNFIFKEVETEGMVVDLYVSPFYLYVDVKKGDDLNSLFHSLNVDDILMAQSLQNLTVMTEHRILGDSDAEIFDILDNSAFPIMDDTTLSNGRYLDMHDFKQFSIDLLRIIRKGEVDGEPKVEVSLQTRAVPSEGLELDSVEMVGLVLKEMYNASLNEVTRCFKGL